MKQDTTTHFFIAGTDTGVGKTLVSAALLQMLSARGLRAVGMKPVASGALRVPAAGAGQPRWHNEDVAALRKASSVAVPGELDNPYLFEEPTAPHLAAADQGIRIDLDHILACYRALSRRADAVVVEGVGGLLVPLDEHVGTDDLALKLGLPVILVVGIRLGCINHALLTVHALAAKGLPLHGWVATILDRHMRQLAPTLDCLRRRIPAPLMGTIPHLSNPDPADAAAYLDLATPSA